MNIVYDIESSFDKQKWFPMSDGIATFEEAVETIRIFIEDEESNVIYRIKQRVSDSTTFSHFYINEDGKMKIL